MGKQPVWYYTGLVWPLPEHDTRSKSKYYLGCWIGPDKPANGEIKTKNTSVSTSEPGLLNLYYLAPQPSARQVGTSIVT